MIEGLLKLDQLVTKEEVERYYVVYGTYPSDLRDEYAGERFRIGIYSNDGTADKAYKLSKSAGWQQCSAVMLEGDPFPDKFDHLGLPESYSPSLFVKQNFAKP